MKISCLPVSLFADVMNLKMSIKELAHLSKESGLDGMDLGMGLVFGQTQTYVDKMNADIASEDMNLIMITTYPDFTHPDVLQREREEAYFVRDIALASQLHAKYLRILAGQAHPGTSRADGIGWAVESFKRMSDVAEKYGVMLLYENHSKPGAWDNVDFSFPTDIFLEICEKTKDTNIRINFDTCNTLAYGDDPMVVLGTIFDRLETIHAADIREKGQFHPCLVGEGAVPFEEIFSYVKSRGWDKWICIEEASGTGPSALKKARDFVRTTWDNI